MLRSTSSPTALSIGLGVDVGDIALELQRWKIGELDLGQHLEASS